MTSNIMIQPSATISSTENLSYASMIVIPKGKETVILERLEEVLTNG